LRSTVTPRAITEPITVEELLALARIVPGDEETPLCPGYISAARQQVERDTDLGIAQASYVVTFDAWPASTVLELPYPPLVSVESVIWTDTDNVEHTVPATSYVVDTVSVPGRIIWTPAADWQPPATEPRAYAAWAVTFTAGYDTTTIPPLLKWAVGLLASHYLTTGRDLTIVGTSGMEMPMGYAEAIRPFRLESVA
jgi:uncharacterized phiE125 gp8 family phage protein